MSTRMRTDVLLLVAFCGFLFFYGLGAFGLLGADEPRYAQVAREMGSGSYFLQNACPTLLERNALTGLRAARCREVM